MEESKMTRIKTKSLISAALVLILMLSLLGSAGFSAAQAAGATPPFEAATTVSGNTATVSVRTKQSMQYSSLELKFNGALPGGFSVSAITDGADIEDFDAAEDPNVGEEIGLYAILNNDHNVSVAAGKELVVYTFDMSGAEPGTYNVGFIFSAASDLDGNVYNWEDGTISASITKTAPAVVPADPPFTAVTEVNGNTATVSVRTSQAMEYSSLEMRFSGELPAGVTVSSVADGADISDFAPTDEPNIGKEIGLYAILNEERSVSVASGKELAVYTFSIASAEPGTYTVSFIFSAASDIDGDVYDWEDGVISAEIVKTGPSVNYDEPPFEAVAAVSENTATVSIRTNKEMAYSSLEVTLNSELPAEITLASIDDGADISDFAPTDDPIVGEEIGRYAILNEERDVSVTTGKELVSYTFSIASEEPGTCSVSFIFSAASDISGDPYSWEDGVITVTFNYNSESDGYIVTINNTTKNKASVDGIVNGDLYSGDKGFTVTCVDACVVAYSTDGGATYTKLAASGTGETRSFIVPVNSDTIVFIALKGDATLDGRVNATDATQVKRYAVQLRTFGPENLLAADVTGEGRVNATDATQIKRFAVQLRTFEW